MLVLLSVLALLGMTGTAFAHGQLDGSDPPSGAVASTAPKTVTLSFDEPVEPTTDAIQVFDDHLRRVDDNRVIRLAGDGNRIQVGLQGELQAGTYTVSWHASAADTHPVSGTFQFSIDRPSQVRGVVPGAGRNDVAGWLLGVLRAAGYAGLITGPGVLLVTLTLWPAGLAVARTRRTLYLGLGLLASNVLGSMLLEGVWASGRPLSAMWSAPSSLDTHSRRFDLVYSLRLYLLAGFAALLVALVSGATRTVARAGRSRMPPVEVVPARARRRAAVAATATTTLALLATWSLAGHAAAGKQSPIAVAVDVVHLLAMTVWLGGLVLVWVSLRQAVRAADLARVLPRFSRLAFAAVGVLVGSGTYQAWRGVGSIEALRNTTYGRLLQVKLLAVLGLLLLGNLARRWVQRHLTTVRAPSQLIAARNGGAAPALTDPEAIGHPNPLELRALRRGLAAELALSAAVLGLTSALVVTMPARQSSLQSSPQTSSTTSQGVSLVWDAPRVGGDVARMLRARPAW